jgi:hypothetical protein
MRDSRYSTNLWAFFAAFGHRWLTLMSGPLTVPFAALAVYLDQIWQKTVFGILAVLSGGVTSFIVWRAERARANELQASLDHMDGPFAVNLIFDDREQCQGQEPMPQGAGMVRTGRLGIHNGNSKTITRMQVEIEEIEPTPTPHPRLPAPLQVMGLRHELLKDVRYEFDLDPQESKFVALAVGVDGSKSIFLPILTTFQNEAIVPSGTYILTVLVHGTNVRGKRCRFRVGRDSSQRLVVTRLG